MSQRSTETLSALRAEMIQRGMYRGGMSEKEKRYLMEALAQEPGRSRAYREKHKEKIQAYQKNYYLKNRDAISEQKKIKYRFYFLLQEQNFYVTL